MSARVNPFFSPTQISGCSLWLDAADPTTMSFSGMNVTQWNDKSGNGRNATVFNASPTYSSGTKAVQFSGTQGLTTSLSASLTVESGFIVGSVTNVTTVNTLVGCFNANGGRQFRINNQLQTIKQDIAVVLNSGATLSNSTLYILEFTNDGTTLTHYLTGSSYASGSSVSYDAGRTTSIGLRYGPPPVEGMTGSIFEICMYTVAVSTFQRQQVEGYLAWKWGLQSSLPATHPYKTSIIPPLLNPPTTPAALVQNTTPTWLPTQISGCQLWLDAIESTNFVFSSGSNISSWRDKSGFGRNATAVNSPTYNSGSNGVRFVKASAQYFTLPDGTYPAGNSSYSYLFVISPGAVTQNQILSGGTFANGQMTGIRSGDAGSGTLQTYWINFDLQTSNTYTLNAKTFGATYYASGGGRSLWLNFTQGAADTPGTRSQTTSNNVIGTIYSFTTEYYTGQFHELIVYDTSLSTAQRQQAEGYLAWKWGLQGSLSNSHPYKQAPPFVPAVAFPALSLAQTAGFNPTRISGCSLWLDASDRSSLLLSGTNVTQWTDKSGTTNVTQSTTSLQPTYVASGFNTRPTIRVTGVQGSSYQELTTATTSLYDSVTSMYVFIVYRVITPVPSNPGIFSIQNKVSYYLRGLDNNNNFTGSNVWTYNGASFVANNDTIVTYDQNAFLCLGLDNGFQSTFLNGSFTGAPKAFSFGSGTSLVLRIGYSGYNTNDGFNGNISEVLVYRSSLTTSQRQQVEGYLAWKWGLQGSLPATHPWKQYPPPPS